MRKPNSEMLSNQEQFEIIKHPHANYKGVFIWEYASLIKTGYFKDNKKEVCMYTDGTYYAAVSHAEDKCITFTSEKEFDEWVDKCVIGIVEY